MQSLTKPSGIPARTLMWARPVTIDDDFSADIAVLGIPFGDPYTMAEVSNDQTLAPLAMRTASLRYDPTHNRHDFDIGGTTFDGQDVRFVDCGDVIASVHEPRSHYALAQEAVRRIARSGAMLIALGGDHGITTPVLRGFADEGPLVLVHIDAHLDWRDEVNGVREGYSSPIRRASEMPHVTTIVQIGLRALGSARPEDYQAAVAAGARMVTADALHEHGVKVALDAVPAGARYYISIDADGLDPTVMPAVAGPTPGGLTFHQVRQIIHGVVKKGRVVGMDIVEITPSRDVNAITSVTANRIIINLIGAAVRAGYFQKKTAAPLASGAR